MRAYYVAEAGGRYIIPQVAQDPVTAEANFNGKVFALSDNEQFEIAVDNNSPFSPLILIQSMSTVNGGTWLEAKRTISYLIKAQFKDSFVDPLFLADNWIKDEHSAFINSTDRSDNEPALNIRGKEVYVNLNWAGNTNLSDLAEWRSENNGLLNYELQVKIKEDTQGSLGEHYMWGLSFRLNTGTDSTYGISFFRSIGREDQQRPGWIDELPSAFDGLMSESGERYIVLWKKEVGIYSLLDYKKLNVNDGVLLETGVLKPWSTIMVRVFEFRDEDDSGKIKNKISGFIRGEDSLPRNTIDWDLNSFMAVEWVDVNGNTQSNPIIDGSLTTAGFDDQRAEIGLHALYDSPAANDQFFQDFAMNLLSNSGGVFIERIQY
jgi:hypothetical protein